MNQRVRLSKYGDPVSLLRIALMAQNYPYLILYLNLRR